MPRAYKKCYKCDGYGLLFIGTPEETQCDICDGEGESYFGRVGNVSNVIDSHEILEALDPTEHAALTDTQKDGVLHILSCGFVDLNDGKAGKVRLWNWFGAESTTVANLTALLE